MNTITAQDQRLAVLAAGGTGGHLFPAQALAEELRDRGLRIHLMTDERVRDYGKNFPAEEVHIIPSATLSLSKPFTVPGRALRLVHGILKARSVLQRLRPAVVAGFGGYPSFPPLTAAASLGLPTLLHEQNAVLGRANARLARKATRIALSFPQTRNIPDGIEGKSVVTGNPVRAMVLKQANVPYPALSADGDIRLLVFGGSQGARYFSEFMPDVLRALPVAVRARLAVTQQCRPEDLDQVRKIYGDMGLRAELAAFFSNLPERMAQSHLVLSRSGASTIAELGVVGRPAIMVPLPHAIDNDQLRNAQSFASAGAGWVFAQQQLTATTMAEHLGALFADSHRLEKAAEAARTHGRPDAAARLADLAQSIAMV